MLRHTPPLDAICVFEAVGRLSSLTRAAQELFVTPSAVSHHINTLEQYLGVSLLRRVGNRVELTLEGRSYHHRITAGIGQILQGTQQFRAARRTHLIRVAVSPAVANSWLIPSLPGFTQAEPTLSISINASPRGEADLAIRYMEPSEGDPACVALGDNAIFPVCSARLMRGPHALHAVGDLSKHTLLRDVDELDRPTTPGWDTWLRAAGVPDLRGARDIFFSTRDLAQQAAIAGLGVALTRTLLAARSISERALVCPFGPVLAVPSRYCVLCTEPQLKRREVAAFREWLIDEAAALARKVAHISTRQEPPNVEPVG